MSSKDARTKRRKSMKPTSFVECEKMNCHKCDVYIEGTMSSRSFASNFQKEDCWTRNNFSRPSWEDPIWDSLYETEESE